MVWFEFQCGFSESYFQEQLLEKCSMIWKQAIAWKISGLGPHQFVTRSKKNDQYYVIFSYDAFMVKIWWVTTHGKWSDVTCIEKSWRACLNGKYIIVMYIFGVIHLIEKHPTYQTYINILIATKF